MTLLELRRFGPLAILVAFAIVGMGVRIAVFVRRTGTNPLGAKTRSGGQPLHGFLERNYLVAFFLLGALTAVEAVFPETPDAFGRFRFLERAELAIAGAALGAIGLAWTYASQGVMGRSWRIGIPQGEKTELVARGAFRFCRNPIYLGMEAALVGVFLVAPNAVFALAVWHGMVLTQIQVRCEEEWLRATHGEAYLEYGRRVGRFFPWWGRFPSAGAPR